MALFHITSVGINYKNTDDFKNKQISQQQQRMNIHNFMHAKQNLHVYIQSFTKVYYLDYVN